MAIKLLRLAALLPLLLFCPNLQAQQILIPTGAVWKFLDNGSNQGTTWRQPSFNDTAWNSGPAQLGYGDGDEATVVSFGPNSGAKYITTYFRRAFNVPDVAAINTLSLRLLRDDGAVVYLNGMEVYRNNMPGGTISSTTLASVAIGGADESAFYTAAINKSFLVTGNNVLAVEMHQANGTSSDLSFDLQLTANGAATISRGPYLQLLTPQSVIVRWRTDMSTATRLRYGTAPGVYTSEISDGSNTTEHVVQVTGLSPDTTYYYQAGTADIWFPADANNNFVTAPPIGTAKPTRIWVLGDSGTADSLAAQVRDGFFTYTGARGADLWLMLGDNAYDNGTDAEYQNAVFNMYPTMLRNRALWPTLGNHDTASSANPPASLPYFQMFNLPTAGEAGGISSGTEKYYSFDYGQIHFVCLDSMSSDPSAGGTMYNWLQNDLLATTQPWIIAFFHHPPYSRGSHNSDTSVELVQMRQNFLPLLEAGGVDLVLAGHSHSYERSFLLNGHYGTSGTLDSSMILDGGSGRENDTGAYVKPLDQPSNRGAVYSVAGSSGKISGGALNHPAMYISLNLLGSLVLDVNGARMDVAFVDNTAVVRDYFTILKQNPPAVPPAAPNGLIATAISSSEISLSWNDQSTNETGFEIERSLDGTTFALIGTMAANATAGLDQNLAPDTTYIYRIRAFNSGGYSAYSSVDAATTLPATPPPAPGDLTAVGGNARVDLSWTASSGATGYNIKRSTTAGSGYVTLVADHPGSSYTDFSVANGVVYYYVVSAMNAAGEGANSAEVSALPMAPPAAPANASAGGISSRQIQLSWQDNADNESGFRIERSTNGVAYSQIAQTVADITSYVDSGLVPGTTYHYRVRAFNSSGDSATVGAVGSTLLPVAPQNLSAIAGNSQVQLSWEGTPQAESYTVKRALNTGGPYATVASGITALSYNDSGLQNGTTYYYVVVALEVGVSSAHSSEASATPQGPPGAVPPAAPAGLIATAVSPSQIDLSWTDNSTNEDGFQLERSLDSLTWAEAGVVSADTTSWSDTGLTQGTTYSYRVRAFNDAGFSPFATPAQATTFSAPIDSVAQAEDFVAGAVTGSYVDTWSDNSVNEVLVERESGGKPASRYSTLQHRWTFNVAGGYAVTLFANVSASSSTDGDAFAFSYSTDGVSYSPMFTVNGSQDPNVYRSFALPSSIQGTLYVRVDDTDRRAGNRTFDSLFVDHLYIRSQPGVPMPPPAAPAGLTAIAVDSGRIQLTWVDQSSNEDGFKVERSRNGTDFTQIATVGVSGTSFEDTGLEASATYYYRVRSFNSGAHSEFSNIAQATTLAGPPLAPSGLIATAISRSEIGLSWTDNSGNETSFVIEQSADGVTFTFLAQTAANVTTYTDTGLVSNRIYYYRVRASNAQGNSAYSNIGSAKTPKR